MPSFQDYAEFVWVGDGDGWIGPELGLDALFEDGSIPLTQDSVGDAPPLVMCQPGHRVTGTGGKVASTSRMIAHRAGLRTLRPG